MTAGDHIIRGTYRNAGNTDSAVMLAMYNNTFADFVGLAPLNVLVDTGNGGTDYGFDPSLGENVPGGFTCPSGQSAVFDGCTPKCTDCI